MSKIETKRVSLTSINGMASNMLPLSVEAAAPARFGADFLTTNQSSKQKVNDDDSHLEKSLLHTIRFSLELFQPDSTSYPSFNYSKLIAGEKKKHKKTKEKQNGFRDPFDDNDDDVARIARELEKKYGNAYSSTKGRNKKDDFCDIGMGYDESDSFIDNTEAYDEVVPEEVETIEGGFYINCGALEFKSLRPEKPPKTRTDDIIKMPERSKKMIITSSSDSDESDSSDDDDDDDDDDNSDSDDEDSNDGSSVKTTKSKDSSSVPSSTTSTVKSLKTKKSLKKTKNITSSSNSPRPESDVDAPSRAVANSIKTTTIKDMLKAKRDKFFKHQTDSDSKTITIEIKSSSNKTSENESSNDESSDSDDSDSSNIEEREVNPAEKNPKPNSQTNQKENSEKLRTTDTKLPDLEDDVKSGIQQFRDMVKNLNLTGKKFQFTENLKDLFLRIDESLLCVEKAQRNMVFAHLEFHLTLPKYYFLRKAKQLRITEEKQKTSHAINKLNKAISEIMPQCFANYTALKNSIPAGDSDQLTVTPKKKFLWNNNTRTLLYEAYQVRWTSYPVLGTRKQTLEEFISGFMKTKIVNLWPNGWMCYEELQKEIEKQKHSLKKNKLKEKASNITNSNTNNNANVNNNLNSNSSKEAGTNLVLTTTSTYNYKTPIPNFGLVEDFENRSKPQSSTATTTKASSLKRKNSEASIKNTKTKNQKLNNAPSAVNLKQLDQVNVFNQKQNPSVEIALDLVSPTKKMEGKISVVSTASLTYSGLAASAASTSSTSNLLITSNQHSKAQNEHRTITPTIPATHIIDLDNYSTTSEILKTTKKLAAARVSTSNILQKANESDDNDCVEFVGIIPASSTATAVQTTKVFNPSKPKTTKKAQANTGVRSVTPNLLSPFNTYTPEMASIYAQNINPAAMAAKSANDIKSLMNNLDAFKVIKSLEEFNRNYVNQQNALSVNPLYTGSNSTNTQNNKQKPRE